MLLPVTIGKSVRRYKSNLTYKTIIIIFNYTCFMFNQVERRKFNEIKRFEQMIIRKNMQINHKNKRP